MSDANPEIGAVVLAAGLSTRMGQPKMLLPWVGKTVIETVVETLLQGGIVRPEVVVGAEGEQITRLLNAYPVQVVFNPSYRDGEMIHSLQVGLSSLNPQIEAVLIVLGDQPQLQSSTIRLLIEEFRREHHPLIIPSFHMRRGHPWLVGKELWADILNLRSPATMRNFIQQHSSIIKHLNVETPSILADLDTPEDYEKYQPG